MAKQKKVLIISSSPREGNSLALCEQFAAGARTAGREVELIRLSDYSIGYCRACGHCNNHRGECTIKDDASAVMHKMLDADVIALATPAYFYSVSAQLKTLIDRSCPYYLELGNRDYYYLVSAFDPNADHIQPVIAALRGFTADCIPDCREKGMVIAAGVAGIGDIDGTPYLKQAYDLGRKC